MSYNLPDGMSECDLPYFVRPECPRCGYPFEGTDTKFEVEGEMVCRGCFIEWVIENFNARKIADALDVRYEIPEI